MKSNFILLLTRDAGLEEQLNKAARKSDNAIVLARSAGEALQILCTRGQELNLAVLDFEDGCRGMTLLNALSMLRRSVPSLVATSTDRDHAAALAYANGATACLAKPTNAAELEITIRALSENELQLAA